MAKQTIKPNGNKAVTAITSGKSKTSKAAATTIAKSPDAKKPAVKKLTGKSIKSTTAPTKKSAKPVTRKSSIPAAEKKIIAKKTTEKKSRSTVKQKTEVNPTLEERYRMVELAAYFIAEQNGFQGRADEYWVAAENQIAARLGP